MLMPWIPGTTWFDIITRRVVLTPRESVQFAQAAAHVLATIEANGLTHCDIAGANVMIDRAAGSVELVDIEEMHGPGMPRPVELSAGQEGYQHRSSAHDGQWTAEGDRFGGAILLAEMLTWHNPDVRNHSADEHYFAASEMQQPDSPRYELLHEILRGDYTLELADHFEAAWRSAKLRDCPPLSVWQTALGKLDPSKLAAQPVATSTSNGANPVVSGRRPLVAGAASETPTRVHLRVPMKLCPRCGAQNPVNAEFCASCHYYLGGSQRSAVPYPAANPNYQHGPAQPPITPPASSAPPLINARRMVGSGQSGQVVPTPQPAGTERTDGGGIILALVVGVVIAIIILALIAH
jgi:ribosomal protein L40E